MATSLRLSTADLLDSATTTEDHGHGVAVTLTPIISPDEPSLAIDDPGSAVADHETHVEGRPIDSNAQAMADHDNGAEGLSPVAGSGGLAPVVILMLT